MFKKTWNEINNFKRQKDEDERTNCGALYWLLETKSDSRGSGEMTVQCGNHRSGSSRISSVLSFCSYISLILDADRTVKTYEIGRICVACVACGLGRSIAWNRPRMEPRKRGVEHQKETSVSRLKPFAASPFLLSVSPHKASKHSQNRQV